MKLGFQIEEWTYLKNIYGENVFDNDFFIKDIYFTKWINPINEKGFCIIFNLNLYQKPLFTLKNWEHSNGADIHLRFDGDLGLGLFGFQNRKLLKLKYQTVKLKFIEENQFQHHKVIVYTENTEVCFFAKSLFTLVNRL